MKVQVIRSAKRQQIDVYDADGVHLVRLPWDHLINSRLGESVHVWFQAEWCSQPGGALEFGERIT